MIYGLQGREMIQMSRIEITLKSDLCAASGDGFSSVIDTDVSYDRYGFPVIGGRRLKGCLKQAAEYISSPNINKIFGVTGSNLSGSLKISNAVVKDYDNLRKEATVSGLDSNKVISFFTYTRSSTAIENDTAKDNSLRIMRVVKHYSPINKDEELTFYADVEIDDEYKEEFADICKALRHIGYKRNRGYGAVKCRFEDTADTNCFNGKTDDCGENAELTYTIRLKSNVMIPGKSANETLDYIPGTSVIGFFASEYLKTHSEDTEFDEIFQKNNVRFSNLYISDSNGKEYFPAPVILGKIKGESGIINLINYQKEDERIPKPLKGGYCDFSSHIMTPLTETVYHHSTGKDSTLYTQTSLSEGQYFRGTISGKAEYIRKIADILKNTSLRFGRSKTAQYSNCELVDLKCSEFTTETLDIKKGTCFIALMLSDVLIPDEFGGYDVSVEGLKKAIGLEQLKCDKDEEIKRSALRYRTIMGYNAKWNIQKSHVRTIAAGSTLVFKAEEDMQLQRRMYVGSKQNEGFGQVIFCPASEFETMSKKKVYNINETADTGILSEFILKNQKYEEMRKEAIDFVAELREKINPSQIGRYLMMVKQADELRQLNSMIDNIKSKQSNKFFADLIKHSNVNKYSNNLWKEYLTLILTLIKYSNRGGDR